MGMWWISTFSEAKKKSTTKKTNLMKDKIQFDSKYHFDLPINHYIFSFCSFSMQKESVLNIILFSCHVMYASYIITFDITKYSTIKYAGNFSFFRSLFFNLLSYSSLLFFSLLHPFFFRFHFLFSRL